MLNKGPPLALTFRELRPAESAALRARLGLADWDDDDDDDGAEGEGEGEKIEEGA
jgi:hypothetical protein